MKLRLALLIVLLTLSGCLSVPDTPDPCAVSNRQGECRLIQAQAQVAAESQIATADAADRLRQQDIKATAEADSAMATLRPQTEALHAQLTLVAGQQTLDAARIQPTETAIAATATQSSAYAQATLAQAALNVQETVTQDAINAQATVTQTFIMATLDAAQVEHNRRATEQTLSGIKEAIFTLLLIVLVGAIVLGLIWGGRRGIRGLAHWLDNRANVIRYGRDNSQIVFVDPYGNVIDPRQIIGPHMLTNGQGQPTDLGDQEQQLQRWGVTVEHAMRNQRVLIAERLTSFDDPAGEVQPDPSLPLLPNGLATLQLPPTPPPFIQLLNTWRPSEKQVLLAYGQDGPIYGPINNLISVKILGMSGMGKTTLLRLVFAQCVLIGARAIAWDSHGNVADDIAGVEAYMRADDIRQSAEIVEHELQDRIDNKLHFEQRLLVLVDEFELLVEICPETLHIIQRIIREGRKYGVYCLVTGKALPAVLFGGSGTRDNFSSGYSFKTTDDQARIAGFDRDARKHLPELPAGYALLQGVGQPQFVAIPDITNEDLKRILPASGSPSTASDGQIGRGNGTGADVVEEGDVLKRERVRQLIKAGKSNTIIISEVWGIDGGGNKYQQAAKELTQILSTLV